MRWMVTDTETQNWPKFREQNCRMLGLKRRNILYPPPRLIAEEGVEGVRGDR